MNEQVKALSRIAEAVERQNSLIDDLTYELKSIRKALVDCTVYPSDERQVPRIVVGIAGAVETIGM